MPTSVTAYDRATMQTLLNNNHLTCESISLNRQLGKWLVEPDRNKLVAEDVEVSLEPRVMDALVLLIERAPETVTIDEMLDTLWPGRIVEASSVHRLINKLRTSLEDSPKEPIFIETVPRRGYRVIPSSLVPIDTDVRAPFSQPKSDAVPQKKHTPFVIAGTLMLMLGAVFIGWKLLPTTKDPGLSAGLNAQDLIGWQPSIAVLPIRKTGSKRKI